MLDLLVAAMALRTIRLDGEERWRPVEVGTVVSDTLVDQRLRNSDLMEEGEVVELEAAAGSVRLRLTEREAEEVSLADGGADKGFGFGAPEILDRASGGCHRDPLMVGHHRPLEGR